MAIRPTSDLTAGAVSSDKSPAITESTFSVQYLRCIDTYIDCVVDC